MRYLVVVILSICALNMIAQQSEAPQNSKSGDEQTITSNTEDSSQYYLKVINKKLHPRSVYVDGNKVGVVKGSSEKVFLLSTKNYKLIELKEQAITFSPKSEQFIIQKRPNDGEIIEIINKAK